MKHHTLPTAPGALIGYRADGRPIFLIAGGSEAAPEGQPAAPAPADADGGAEVTGAPVEPDQPTVADPRKVADLPTWAQKLIKDTRAEAAEFRTQLADLRKQSETKPDGPTAEQLVETARQEVAQQIAKALGLAPEEEKPLDPAEVIEQLTGEKAALTQQNSDAANLLRRTQIELAVVRQSLKAGADAEALLDSRSFLANVRDLDPSDKAFAETVTATIQKAVEENPKFAAAQAAAHTKSGGEFGGGPGGRTGEDQLTVDDFRKRRKRESTP
ncbi:hypothetical protein ABZ815_20230 [Nonomuraea sp. NPDC047529]|uniref:hypothetical protein n=1 Tax=Nonomuraea sp. NPDC047529 TaxID=3155623 RepID=UPI00340CD08E